MDLLTVLLHEYGHALGLEHSADDHDAMAATLQPGMRKLPSADELALMSQLVAQLRDAEAGSGPHDHDDPLDEAPHDSPLLPTQRNTGQRLGRSRSSTAGSGDRDYLGAVNPTLANGDFGDTDGTAGWVAEGEMQAHGADVTLNESVTRQTHLAQGFMVNSGDRLLTFTLAANALQGNATGPGDAFEAALLDANTGLPVAGAVSLSRSDAFLNLQTDGTERLASGVRKIVNADGSATYYIDLPAALANTPVYLSFDLLGFGATQSSVSLRDIRVFSDPVTHDDAFATNEDSGLAGNVLGNDIAATQGMTSELVAAPAHGDLTFNADGSFSYVPHANYFGADEFSYRVIDAEGRISNTATVSLTVRAINDAPVVAPTTPVTVTAGKAYDFQPLAGTSDVDGDALAVEWLTLPAHGTLVTQSDGGVVYTAHSDFVGEDTLSWRITDGKQASKPVVLHFTVEPANTAPMAQDTALTLDEDGSLLIDLPSLGTDAEGDVLTATVTQPPAHGTLVQQPDGRWLYTPAANFHGTDALRFTLSDGHRVSNEATLTLQVASVNDAPVATDLAATLAEDGSATLNPLETAFDADGDALSAQVVAGPAHGVVLLHADGRFSYVPNPDFHGTDTFTYRVADGQSASGIVTVTLTITPVNDAPVARDMVLSVTSGGTATVTLAATDVDHPDAALAYAIVTAPQHGSVAQQADGSWRYTPDAAYVGSDSFTYKARDGQLDSSVATVAITVTAPPALDIDLGVARFFNVFVFHDFISSGSDVEGAIAAGNDLTLSNYSVNANGLAYQGLSAVVGRNLTFYGGSLHGTATYGGAQSTGQLSSGDDVRQAEPDFSFASEEARLTLLSDQIAALPATGSVQAQWGGLTFTGDGTSGVQVFTLSGEDLMSANWSSFQNLNPGQTIIVSVTGSTGGFTGGTPNGFAAYNTLFNFSTAQTLSFDNVGVFGTILAPRAVVSGGGGQINGNVIAKDWNSGIQINANHYFQASSVPSGTAADGSAQTTAPASTTDAARAVLVITGLPVGCVLSDGSRSFTITEQARVANLTGWNIAQLTLVPPQGYTGTLTMEVRVIVSEPIDEAWPSDNPYVIPTETTDATPPQIVVGPMAREVGLLTFSVAPLPRTDEEEEEALRLSSNVLSEESLQELEQFARMNWVTLAG